MGRRSIWRGLLLVLGLGLLGIVFFGPEEVPDPGAESLAQTWRGEFAPPQDIRPGRLRVLNWNIERGLQLAKIQDAIRALDPDLCILQEVDLQARRTGGRNIAEQLARAAGFHYVFAIEFQELSEGSPSSPAYHGQATLTRLPVREQRVLRFAEQSDVWKPRSWMPNWTILQRRFGGRIALLTELDWGGRRLVVYNVHLESRLPAEGRRRQLEELLVDARRYSRETPIVLAGDFNARSQPETLLRLLREEGFQQAAGAGTPTLPPETSVTAPFVESVLGALTGSGPRGEHRSIDWIFVRGPIETVQSRVHDDVRASDHFPVSAEIALTSGR
jgi:endonuclease/exonuclease/phosphatase family metal-dependent hydrolase